MFTITQQIRTKSVSKHSLSDYWGIPTVDKMVSACSRSEVPFVYISYESIATCACMERGNLWITPIAHISLRRKDAQKMENVKYIKKNYVFSWSFLCSMLTIVYCNAFNIDCSLYFQHHKSVKRKIHVYYILQNTILRAK